MNFQSQSSVAEKKNGPLFQVIENTPLYIIKDTGEKSNLYHEIVNWFNQVNLYMYLWQPVRLSYYIYTRNNFFRSAFKLPYFKKLWGNICKGSFAYNTFLFKKPPFSSNYHNSFLADLTCLALLFGDEFIDGVCNEIGKPEVQRLLNENGNKFYLNLKSNSGGRPELEYGFDLHSILPDSIWGIKNEKYGVKSLAGRSHSG